MAGPRLSETDICDRFITPALRQAGWLKERILREHAFTDGRILGRGRLVSRGRRRRAEYAFRGRDAASRECSPCARH